MVICTYDGEKHRLFKICVYRHVRGVFLHKLISGHNFRSMWLLRYKGFTAHPYVVLLFLPTRGFSRLMQTTVDQNFEVVKILSYQLISDTAAFLNFEISFRLCDPIYHIRSILKRH